MFLCGNTCNGDYHQPEIAINQVTLPAKFISEITKKSKRKPNKDASVMLKKSRYDELLKECRDKNTKFTDKEFPPNDKSLDFKVEGREITWRRAPQVVQNCVMVEDDFSPSDIQQGNIGDCYFLSSLAALAQEEERIETIFFNNFETSGHGIYKLVVVIGGAPTEMLIDDYIPVFAATNRPVFCKATGRQIWVMMLEKAWAKIKGSYGAISAGCPHEVLQTFSVAPCYFYPIQQQQDQGYKDYVWGDLVDAADELMPIVAGTKSDVKLPGLEPSHAYTVLDCQNVTSNGKVCRLMRLRNPWGKTQYTGYGSENDKQFWKGVDGKVLQRMRPAVGVNDGDFTLPYQEFMRSFESIDILNSIFGFSYEFQKIKMHRRQPLFVRLDIKQQHEAFITVERSYGKSDNVNDKVQTTNYGYTRIVIAHQLDQDTFEYYDSRLQTDFPDITIYTEFKPGRYIMYVEIDDSKLTQQFEATLSYYFDTLEVKQNKHWEVQYNKSYPNFLEAVYTNHALRLNDDKAKIGPKREDWVKTSFMYQEGGFGYVMCNLDHDTNIRVSLVADRKKIKQHGFYLVNNCQDQQIIIAGQSRIFVFSCTIDTSKGGDIVFPPPGFKVSRIA